MNVFTKCRYLRNLEEVKTYFLKEGFLDKGGLKRGVNRAFTVCFFSIVVMLLMIAQHVVGVSMILFNYLALMLFASNAFRNGRKNHIKLVFSAVLIYPTVSRLKSRGKIGRLSK